MRGAVESYDRNTGQGIVRASDGRRYAFSATAKAKRSVPPRKEANVVFKVKDGEISRFLVVSYRRQWEWVLVVAEALLYLPLSMAK